MKSLSRKERERLQHRREILEAAEKIFAEKGFFNASIQEIARMAEFGVGSLYQYFSSKEELYYCLIRERLEEMTEAVLREVGNHNDPISQLEAFVSCQLKWCEENRRFFQVLVGEMERPASEASTKLREEGLTLYQRHFDTLEKIIQVGMEKKIFRKFDSKKLAIALMGMIHGFTSHWFRFGFEESLAENSRLILEMFLESVILKPGPGKRGQVRKA